MPDWLTEMQFVFLVVLVTFVYLGWSSRTTDPDEFHTVARKAGLPRTIATIFTVFGAPHFGIFTTLAFVYGWPSVSFFCGVVVGLMVLVVLTPRIRAYIPNDAHTFADVAATDIGISASLALSIVAFFFTVAVAATQLILGANILNAVAGVNYEFAVFALILCVCGYLYWGGYKSLLYTDLIQGYIMFLLTAIFAYYVLFANLPVTPAATPRTLLPSNPFVDPFILFLFIGGVFAASGGPELWQRVLTARTDLIARRSLVSAAVLMLTWGIFVVGAGIAISHIDPNLMPKTAFVDFVSKHLPPWMVGLVIMMLLAALVSTADTEIFAAAIIGQKEINRLRKAPTEALDIWTTQRLVLLLGGASFVVAVLAKDLVAALGVITNLSYIMGPLAFAMVLDRGGTTKKARNQFFFTGFVLSSAGFMVVWYLNAFFSWWALLIIIPASIPLAIPGKAKKPVPVAST